MADGTNSDDWLGCITAVSGVVMPAAIAWWVFDVPFGRAVAATFAAMVLISAAVRAGQPPHK